MTRHEYLAQHPQIQFNGASFYASFVKRLFDLVLCLPIALALAPLFLLTALLVKLDSRGPVFFVQERLGRFGATFQALKFRTMIDRERSPDGEVLPGHAEVTRVGAWLRRFKIDELPQVLNILRGDMSLIGPRPALPNHIADYDTNGLTRLLVRPGLTGQAQVNGNIYLTWPERWQWDAYYVQNCSLFLDAMVLFKTAGVVIFGEEKFLNRHESTPQGSDQPTEQVLAFPSTSALHQETEQNDDEKQAA